MRELNFVPPWYRELLHRRRTAWFQLGTFSVLVLGIAAGEWNRRTQLRAAEAQLSAIEHELDGARSGLQKFEVLRALRDQWRRQDQALTSAGIEVGGSRLLSALAQVVPPDVTLTALSFNGSDTAAPSVPPGTASVPPATSARRRLIVTLRGVAAGEAGVANVLAGISKTSLFKHVTLSYAKDREDQERLVREFEVTFLIDLDADGEERG